LALLSWLFGVVAFSIPYAVGAATGKRGVTMTIGLIITFGSFLLSTFAKSVDWLTAWDKLSLLHYYDTHSLVLGSFNRADLWLLSLLMLLVLLIATLVFRHRDIA
jgi:ABC-2 type transport system permease protein